MEYDRVSPIGETRADWRAASICCTFANMIAVSHGVKKRFRVKDFLIEFGDTEKKVEEPKEEGKTWQQMKQIAMMLTAESKGRFAKKKRR